MRLRPQTAVSAYFFTDLDTAMEATTDFEQIITLNKNYNPFGNVQICALSTHKVKIQGKQSGG